MARNLNDNPWVDDAEDFDAAHLHTSFIRACQRVMTGLSDDPTSGSS